MRYLTLTLAIALGCAPLSAADTKVTERLGDAADFFSEVMSAPDKAVPQDLLNKAQCVILVPGLKKAAFVFGGKFGRGFVVCRASGGMGWGPPAAVRVEGGSAGFQIGISSTDVLLLVMNERGMKRLTESKFTIGAEATAAAGPVGRDATAQTDALMTAEILSWSRSHGLFAGVSLDGATLRNDLDVNKEMYGQPWENRHILTSGAKPPAAAAKLLAVLNKYSARKTN
jgi:lipid-binding SYLF domain-containing protein